MNYFAVVFEKKDHFIIKIPALSHDQKAEIIEFFRKKPQFESKIDWNNWESLTYDNFKQVMKDEVKIKSSGIAKIKEDYIEIDSLDEVNKAYVPLTWKGSQYLASNAVGGMEGKWCISQRDTKHHWDMFMKKVFFVVYVTPSEKYALAYSFEMGFKSMWNRWDTEFGASVFEKQTGINVSDLIRKNKSLIERSIPKLKRGIFLPNADGNVDVSYSSLTYIDFPEKNIKGRVNIRENQITSLRNGPEKVGRYFDCSSNEISSLKEGPKIAKTGYDCSFNPITSLVGSPKETDEFLCMGTQIKNLEGAPEKVNGDFVCSNNKFLISLKGAPKFVKGDFICDKCAGNFTEDDVRAVCKVGGNVIAETIQI